ncbi:hypothetical protein P3S67_003827 [Capsicum chacoense]
MSVKVKCISDAGYFIDQHFRNTYFEQYYDDVVTLHVRLRQEFATMMYFKVETRFGCFFPQNVAQEIQTPFFFINSAIDSWQVRNILVAPGTDPQGVWKSCTTNIHSCTPSQLKVLQGFRLDFLKAFEGLGPSSTRGYYINSFLVHCQATNQARWFGPKAT